MRFLVAAAAAVVLSGGLAACGSTVCPFGNITRTTFQGSVTGAFATHDVVVASETDLEVDLSHAVPTGQAAKADLWLTTSDCARLFDQPYPTASGAPPAPLCRVFLGPVAGGTVSARVKVDAGRYRIFVQAYTANEAAPTYVADLGVWGRSCTINRTFAP